MKRITRRVLGGCIGLALGWYVAGLAPSFNSGLRVSMAEDSGHHAPAAATQPSTESRERVTGTRELEESELGLDGPKAADQLVPGQPEQQVHWFWPVVWAAAGLFIAAVVLGVPSLKLRGPLPPDPADTAHDDDHAAHDDHGHGHDDHAKPGHH